MNKENLRRKAIARLTNLNETTKRDLLQMRPTKETEDTYVQNLRALDEIAAIATQIATCDMSHPKSLL